MRLRIPSCAATLDSLTVLSTHIFVDSFPSMSASLSASHIGSNKGRFRLPHSARRTPGVTTPPLYLLGRLRGPMLGMSHLKLEIGYFKLFRRELAAHDMHESRADPN